MMNDLLAIIIDAHGGMEHWNGYEKVDATIVSGGGFFPLKGVPQDSDPRRMTVWLHEERSSVMPYGVTPDVNSGHEIFSCCDLPSIELSLIDSRG